MKYIIFSILLIIGLAGCQTFAGEDVPATLSYEMTAVATEAALIQQTVQIEQTDVVETLQASGTAVANASNVNQVLAATVRVNILPTSAMREVIVNSGDMGDSLDTEMMEDENIEITSEDMLVQSLGIARSVRSSDGCSNGSVTQFTDDDERVYFTAQVFNLANNINFSVDWVFEERLVYRSVWTSDYSASSECIWFYMTPDDAPFLPGLYTVTLFVNGNALPSQQFSISIG